MRTKFYLHVTSNGSTRTTKSKVQNYIDEIAIQMELDLPDSLFTKPLIKGKITISEDMVNPKEIDAVVKDEIKNAIESVDGIKLELIMPKEETDE